MPKTAAEHASAGKGDNGAITGKVLETMNSGGYTYVNLQEKKGTTTWFAIPASPVTVGSTVTVKPGMPMGEFYSKSLKRKFSSIVFSPGLVSDTPEESADKLKALAHKGVDLSAGFKGNGSSAEPMATIKVHKAKGANAYRVAELFAKKGPTAGKKVVVRGKVVKVSEGIMRRNWLHLRDGSGSAAKKDDELVVTSPKSAKVGEVVTVRGTLVRDKDFGAGYRFAVIVEDAEISR